MEEEDGRRNLIGAINLLLLLLVPLYSPRVVAAAAAFGYYLD